MITVEARIPGITDYESCYPILVDDEWGSQDARLPSPTDLKLAMRSADSGFCPVTPIGHRMKLIAQSSIRESRAAEFRRVYKNSSIFSLYIQRQLYWISI
jgi:hypothetical protein